VDRSRRLVSLIRNNRGSAVVEFALVLPLLLLIVFGITEFGRAWMTVNIISGAAREGARLAAVTEPDVIAVQNRVTDVCTSAGITPSNIVVTPPDPNDPERRVTVLVETNFTVIPGNILGTFSGTVPLRSTMVMRHETF
jgi:Flp pilus assembly protein TadG